MQVMRAKQHLGELLRVGCGWAVLLKNVGFRWVYVLAKYSAKAKN